MGAWGASITGNDTALDLIYEYKFAFSRYDVETALTKLDTYIRGSMFDESDEDEWANYKYSLADFMWKKGILTDEIRDQVLDMIDSGFGLELWAEAGDKALAERRKVLEAFRAKITSPQCAPKRITTDIYEDIFNNGDVIAVKVKTIVKNKKVGTKDWILEERFYDYDGKYVVLRKAGTIATLVSGLDPDLYDHAGIYQLFRGVYDSPEDIDINRLVLADLDRPYLSLYSKMSAFKKRGCVVIGNIPQAENEKDIYINDCSCFGWSCWDDPDYRLLLGALGLN